MKKKALITGISGQDGALLSQLLISKGYQVFGTSRDPKNSSKFWRLKELDLLDKVEILPANLNPKEIIVKYCPDEVYNLQGQSSVARSFIEPAETIISNAHSTLDWLEVIRTVDSKIKFYQASSAEIFGETNNLPKDESAHFQPRSPYAVAKLFSHFITINYREAYKLFACCGILFNHESPLREEQYITQKIAKAVVAIKNGRQACLEVGNLSAARDWGHARDYVQGIYLIMQQKTADDYVLATGNLHTVRDFITLAFQVVGIELIWEGEGVAEVGRSKESGDVVVKVNSAFYRPLELIKSLGNPRKALDKLGWAPLVSFEDLVTEMVEHELVKMIA